ncbi:MAG: DUF2179 domain-containing protein [Chloroflexi bacterium]|nr:DUF2179 domain-containing protein [Chloroflexota bacterium]
MNVIAWLSQYPGGFDWYVWVILPLLVFFARVIDVTLGTLRIIFISRGKKYLAPLLGFVEVFIWVAVIAQITRGANNIVAYLAYAAGFAAGNFIGMFIEDRLAIGTLVVRVIVQNHTETLISNLHAAGFGVTSVDAQGAVGPVALIYTVVKRRDLSTVVGIIHQSHPKAFLSIEEARSTQEGIFPVRQNHKFALFERKGK